MAYTLHVDRGVPRIVAAAAADPPNDPDVVALPGGAVTADQAQRHNAQATAMEQAIVPLRASELIMLLPRPCGGHAVVALVRGARTGNMRSHSSCAGPPHGGHRANLVSNTVRCVQGVQRVQVKNEGASSIFIFYFFKINK